MNFKQPSARYRTGKFSIQETADEGYMAWNSATKCFCGIIYEVIWKTAGEGTDSSIFKKIKKNHLFPGCPFGPHHSVLGPIPLFSIQKQQTGYRLKQSASCSFGVAKVM